MTCLIIDDDPSIRIVLHSLIEEIPFLQLLGECKDGMEGFVFLQKTPVDLLFLDVEMPRMNGIEFLDSLTHKPMVIMITSKREYAVEAFEHQAIDYIVKPITEKRFLTAVAKAKDMFDQAQQLSSNNQEFIFIKDKTHLTKINFADILFIQAMGDYMKVQTAEKWYILHSTMKVLEERLPKHLFFRTHRSYMVNYKNIDAIEDNIAKLKSYSVVIGEQYKAALLKLVNLI